MLPTSPSPSGVSSAWQVPPKPASPSCPHPVPKEALLVEQPPCGKTNLSLDALSEKWVCHHCTSPVTGNSLLPGQPDGFAKFLCTSHPSQVGCHCQFPPPCSPWGGSQPAQRCWVLQGHWPLELSSHPTPLSPASLACSLFSVSSLWPLLCHSLCERTSLSSDLGSHLPSSGQHP